MGSLLSNNPILIETSINTDDNILKNDEDVMNENKNTLERQLALVLPNSIGIPMFKERWIELTHVLISSIDDKNGKAIMDAVNNFDIKKLDDICVTFCLENRHIHDVAFKAKLFLQIVSVSQRM